MYACCLIAHCLTLQGSNQLHANLHKYISTVLADDNVFDRWAASHQTHYMQFMDTEWEHKVSLFVAEASNGKLQVRMKSLQCRSAEARQRQSSMRVTRDIPLYIV
jgi:hypothetical protein